jgi:hypothetical protein
MIYSGGDLAYSLRVCDALSTQWDRSSCTGGVFMQAFLPPMPGMTSAALRTNGRQSRDLIYPCNVVAERDKVYCYLQITSRILPHVSYNWARAARWCHRAETGWVATCFQSLGRDISGATRQDPVQIAQLCSLAATSSAECLYGAVRDLTANDAGGARAAKLCALHTSLSPARCFSAIGSILGGLATTREARRLLCRGVTPVPFRRSCFEGAAAL